MSSCDSQQRHRLARFVIIGAIAGLGIGAIVGLIVGLYVYPPTYWAAAIELRVPATAVGALIGLAATGLIVFVRRAEDAVGRD